MTTGYQPVTSIDDWKSRSSTKIDLLIKLVQHCLKSDNIAMPTFDEDGNAHWPPLADLAEGQQHPRTRKILVSQEFPMMADLIQSVPFYVSYLAFHLIPFWLCRYFVPMALNAKC